jgi:fatty acid desaturase
MSAHPVLTREQVGAFQAELDAVRADVVASLGELEARYIRRVVRVKRGAEAAGRALLAFGFDPISWVIGVGALSCAKILENMEIGHNVLHGQYDWMNDPSLQSATYEWDIANAAEDWRRSHNLRHHTWTNVLGIDDDFGYGVFRMCPEQEWKPIHRIGPLWNVVLALGFQWGIGSQDVKIADWFAGRLSTAELRQRARPFLRKGARQLFKDYALFPLLTPWNGLRVLAGNLAANTARNVWTHTIIFCGHFTEGIHTFTPQEIEGESRGDWYLRQILGSSNLQGGRALHVLSGHLSHQIEHHLFPDLPSFRYPDIAVRVREICARYGVPYNTGSLATQYLSMWSRLWTNAWRPACGGRAAAPVLAGVGVRAGVGSSSSTPSQSLSSPSHTSGRPG